MNAANFLLLAAALGGHIAPEPAAGDSSHYSFVDVYRLTVTGAAPAPAALAGPTLVASQPPSELRFSVSSPGEPEPWLLLVSGLALAGWVAHRRLVQPL